MYDFGCEKKVLSHRILAANAFFDHFSRLIATTKNSVYNDDKFL